MATAGVKIMPLGLGMRLLWIFTSTWKWKVSSELFAFPGFISVVVFFFLILKEIILIILDTLVTSLSISFCHCLFDLLPEDAATGLS